MERQFRTFRAGFCFAADVFFSPRFLRGRSIDRRETLSRHDRNLAELYNTSPKIRGGRSPKKLGAKNMQNFGQFCTPSECDREYFRNETTSKIGKTYELGKFILLLTDKSPVNFGPLTV